LKDKISNSDSPDGSSQFSEEEIRHFIHEILQPLTAINNFARAGSSLTLNGTVSAEELSTIFLDISAEVERANTLCTRMRQVKTS